MRKINLMVIALVFLTGCDPMDFRCKIVNNTDQEYFYSPVDSSYLRSLKSPKEMFNDHPLAKAGDTLTRTVMKYRWNIGNEPAYFFFVKADDLKNYPFDSILKSHMYIQKRYTMEEMQKMNYVVKIKD